MVRAVRPAALLLALGCSVGFVACGGDSFDSKPTTPGQAGEDNAPIAGTEAKSGSGGQSAQGGTAPVGGTIPSEAGNGSESGGAAGAPVEEACPAPATLTDLSQLKLGEAEPLEAINDTADVENLRFARAAPVGSALLYTRDFFGSHIWISPDPTSDEGAPVAPPLAAEGLFESNALILSEPPGPALGGFNLFFQRTVAEDSMQLELLGAKTSTTGGIVLVERLPAPFNAPAATVPWAYGLAIGKNRAIWTYNSDGVLGTGLRTATLDANQEAAELELTLPNGCLVQEIDFAPWLTPDGKTLFFSSRQRDEMCDLVPGDVTALFVVNLDDEGQPVGDAVELAGLRGANAPVGTSFTDASLSPSGCWLYFSSASPEEPHLRLYRAHREP